MITLKILGAFIVMLSCTITGIFFGKKIVYRMEELEQIQRGMTTLKNEITFLATPLPEAFQKIAFQQKNMLSNLFLKTAEEMEQRQGEKGEEIWKQSVLAWQQKTYLEKPDIDALIGFGTSIGYLDIAQQKASIELLLQYIETTLLELQQNKKQQQKLYPSMGVLCGMLIIVLLS